MLSDREKRDAWIKLAAWVNRLDEDLYDLSGEQRWFLRVACIGQMPLIASSGKVVKYAAEIFRTNAANWAAFEAVQVFRTRGMTKMEAYAAAAEHFEKSVSRIRSGIRELDKQFGGMPTSLKFYKDKELPSSYLMTNPDKDTDSIL